MGKIFKHTTGKSARPYFFCCLAFLFLLASCIRSKQPEYFLRWKDGRVIALAYLRPAGAPVSWSSLQVRRQGASGDMLGSTTREDDYLVFTPLVPFTPGAVYRLFTGKQTRYEIRIPYAVKKAPAVTAIHPVSDTLPENLLKFYICFSSPMQQGRALEHISLLDEHGQKQPDIFLYLEPELWDSTGTVLTVWLDPGRIKRGLTLNEREGNPLQEGKRYQLQIAGNWKDTRGISLKEPRISRFKAVKRDERSPSMAEWELSVPRADSGDPLIIGTAEELDHFLVPVCLHVINASHNEVKGTIRPGKTASSWQFIPAAAWKPGKYTLESDPRLEDLAGNNFERLFDRDLTRKYVVPVREKKFVVAER